MKLPSGAIGAGARSKTSRAFFGAERGLRSLFQPIAGLMAPGLGASARSILLILQARAFR